MKLNLFLVVLSLFVTLHGEEPTPASQAAKKEEASTADIVFKEHTLTLNGTALPYTSLTGTLPIKNSDGKTQADLFFTAYFVQDPSNPNRPIAFCFNGGPGSSAIWLHMGMLGPKKVVLQDLAINIPPASYQDNPYTLLPQVDLVFVDPISTGFSRPFEGVDPKQFYSFDGDVELNSEFIREFVTRYNRWGCPKFLVGESYGTPRVVGLADRLSDKYFMNMNGLILISSCLNLANLDYDNDITNMLTLPSYAATAWYHKKLSPELQQKKLQELLAEVEEFAMQDYIHALLMGDRLELAPRKKIAERVASYTGLTPEYILQSNLKVQGTRFSKELLRKESQIVGRFDARLNGYDLDDTASSASYDPSLDSTGAAFTSAFQKYVQDDLNWKKTDPYYVLNYNVQPWDYGFKNQPSGCGYLDVSDYLRRTLVANPALKVFVASGYYDLATPYFSADYTLDHLHLPGELRSNIFQQYYDAGHLMYTHEPSHRKLTQELLEFIALTLPKQSMQALQTGSVDVVKAPEGHTN